MFTDGTQRTMHCALDLDSRTQLGFASIDSGLDRAVARNEVIELYAHKPGVTIPVATIEHVLAGAQQRGLTFYTYEDFAAGAVTAPGIALSFDDNSIQAWIDLLPVLDQYAAKVTFFVCRYSLLTDDEHAEIHQLHDAGHAIEAHTVHHLYGPDYVDQFGLDAYLHGEVDPSIDLLRAEGYPVSAFAYPFGSRTDETDHAIAGRVGVLRSITYDWGPASSPCPF